jgi:hypothetical protein
MQDKRQKLGGLYIGVVDSFLLPSDKKNRSKTEYEYDLSITIDNFTQVPIKHARRMDLSGGPDSFNDETLDAGQKVYVMFLQGMITHPIIVGMFRQHLKPMDASKGRHKSERFNQITRTTDKLGNHSIKSDAGPNLNVNVLSIILDDSTGQSIKLDKVAKKMTINAGEWEVAITGNAKITVAKDATLTVNGNMKATVAKNLDVSGKDVTVNASGECKVKASKDVSVDGKTIKLNGGGGKVITTSSQATCYVTGIPFKGVSKVKAG